MRRIPRPSRAIDPSTPLQLPIRHRVSAIAPGTHARTSAATFSTTASNAFLNPGKQDKKKHQQFVRRWQKRLLGDSEPIGAHVDPYDPTSPVRIAPEEQGDYEEVLEEEGRRIKMGSTKKAQRRIERQAKDRFLYLPADEIHDSKPGLKMMHVGAEGWLQRKLESDMAKEFQKLTKQTYTPMSLNMANEIENLTSTPYTLRDGNLMLAQAVHEVTGKPYTKYNFGLHAKAKKSTEIRDRFAQAVVEVHALKQAGLDMDLAKSPNRGIYDAPDWVKDIKLYKTKSGKFALAYPAGKNAEHFIQAMQTTPAWESAEQVEVLEDEEVLIDEAADLLDPVLLQEPAPTMDPATPAFKRAAIVKADPDRKPFDFMSNRPVPRAKPVETEKVEEIVVVAEPVAEPIVATPSRLVELASAFEASRSAVIDLRHTVLEHRAQRLVDEIATLRSAARSKTSSSAPAHVETVKWWHVPITDINFKFALYKRLHQLTGLHISDPHLSSSKTIGDLYEHLCAAAKPQPTTLHSAIFIEGQKARERAKQAPTPTTSRRRADLGDLIRLGNVELRRQKANKTEKRTKTGQAKVIDYALYERGLLDSQVRAASGRVATRNAKVPYALRRRGAREGSLAVPEFGMPLPSEAAVDLARHTRAVLENMEVERKKVEGGRRVRV